MNSKLKLFIYSFVEFFNNYAKKSLLIGGSLAGVIALIIVLRSC